MRVWNVGRIDASEVGVDSVEDASDVITRRCRESHDLSRTKRRPSNRSQRMAGNCQLRKFDARYTSRDSTVQRIGPRVIIYMYEGFSMIRVVAGAGGCGGRGPAGCAPSLSAVPFES